MATNNAANIVTAVAGTILQGAGVGVAPVFSTATYPSTVATSSILYGSATNVVSELTTTANRILATGTGGVPVWSTSVASDYSFTTSGSGVTRTLSVVHGSNTASSNSTVQVTVAGSSGGDAATKYTVTGVSDWSVGLDNSDSDAFVISSGTALGTNNVFKAASNGDLTVTNIAAGTWNGTAIAATKGGTGQTTYSTGDTLYASAANTLSKLTVGSTGDVLTVAGGVPTWSPASGSGLLRVNRTITSAEIKTMNASPITLISAPGAGLAIQIVGKIYTRFDYGGSNVFVAGAAQQIVINYETSPSTITGAALLTNAQITGTASIVTATDNSTPGTSGVGTPATTTDNKGMQIKQLVATEISGNAANNNTITVSFYYCIVP